MSQTEPTIHSVIHAQAGDYATFPSLARHPSGDLYVVFRQAPQEPDGHISHIHIHSVGILKCSTDNGRTWRHVGSPVPGHLPDSGVQDPSLTILADGTFLLVYFHWRHEPESPKAVQGAVCEGIWVRRSTDQGQSWSDPVQIPLADAHQVAVSEPAIQLEDGELLVVGYAGQEQGGQAALLSRSRDQGRSWSVPTVLAHDPTGMIDFQEPAVLDLGEGHLLCVMRTVDRHLTADLADETARRKGMTAYMYQCHSWDKGLSWSPPQCTAIFGHPPNLIRLADGRIVCSYGHRRDPFGIRACLSEDGGESWQIEREMILRRDGGGSDLGYPSSVALADGSILTAYYIHTEADPLRRIEATRWQPDK